MTKRKKLPKGWRWAKLEDTLSLFDSGTWGKDPVAGGVPVLRSNNIQENRFLFDSDVALRDVPAKKIDRYRLQYGDIVMVKSSGSKKHIGKCAIYEIEEGQTHLFANFTQRLRANTSVIDPFYLYFYLTSDYARDALEQMHATSSGLRNIQPKVYAQQSIPLPPLAEQERIVEVLRQADAIRRKRADARGLADQILPALFLDMFGDPATNPKKWPKKPIGDLVAFETSQVKPEANAEYQYLAPEHIESGTGRFTGPHSTPGGELGSAKNRFSEEHVLYCKLRPYLNKVVLPESSGICSSELVPIRPLGNVSREFLAIYLRLPHFVDSATRKSQGTKMPRFGPTQMAKEYMIVPPMRL